MDISQFKQKFIEEAYTLLENLESDLLELESKPNNIEYIESVFRVMHTFKGVAGMYGLDFISDFTHDLESIYDLVRNKELRLSPQIINLTYQASDHLKNLLQDEDLQESKNREQHNHLLGLIKGLTTPQQNNLDTLTKEKALSKSKKISTWYIVFTVNDNFFKRGINLTHIFQDLSTVGKFQIAPHTNKGGKLYESEQDSWGIYLVTDKGLDAIQDALLFVEDNCKIIKIADVNIFDKQETQTIEHLTESSPAIIDLEKPDFDYKRFDDNKEALSEIMSVPEQSTEEKITTVINKNTLDKKLTTRIQVEAEKLDYMMFLVSELVTTKARLDLISQRLQDEELNKSLNIIDKLTKNFRDNALSMRLVPLSEMLVRFRRLVRDLANSLGKKVEFETQGVDTELDKNIIDALSDPIMHILRNSLDHGIEMPQERLKKGKEESGFVKLTAYHSGSNVFVQIQDDGAGIDHNKIRTKAIEKGLISQHDKLTNKDLYNLIFAPGFSTAETVTEVSGRGVGMDVVKRKITDIRGEIEIDSELGLGTSITIKLRQTISIVDTLLVRSGISYFTIPLDEVEVCGLTPPLETNGNQLLNYNEELIPYINLRKTFEINGTNKGKDKMVVINKQDKRYALITDQIIGEYQAVIKPLGDMFKNQQFLSGGSLLGDGSLALMLDTTKLMKSVK